MTGQQPMTGQKNTHSEGRNVHSEGHNVNSVRTALAELRPVFSFNCMGLAVLIGTPRVFPGRGTQGREGVPKTVGRKCRLDRLRMYTLAWRYQMTEDRGQKTEKKREG